MRTKETQKRNAEIINQLKTIDFTAKERIYATLIIDVLEESNNLDLKLQNCVVEHNIIEKMLFDSNFSFIHDEFGRYESEMGKTFIKALNRLNKEFNKNYPNSKNTYFTKEFNRTRGFIRKLILKLVNPLNLKRVEQKYFTSVSFWDKSENIIWIRWTRGTDHGVNTLNEQFNLSEAVTKKELKKTEKKINAFLDLHSNKDWEEMDFGVMKIIEKSLPMAYSLTQTSENESISNEEIESAKKYVKPSKEYLAKIKALKEAKSA